MNVVEQQQEEKLRLKSEQELQSIKPKKSKDGDYEESDESEDDMMISQRGIASILSSTMNLSNTILGSGLLGLPYAVAQCGYILSAILFVIFGILSWIGLNLSVSAAKTVAPNSSYYTLSKLSVPNAKKLVDLAVAIKCFGVGTSYMIVIGDNMPSVIEEFIPLHIINSNIWIKNRRFWIFIFSAIFIFPIVAFKKLNALKYTSMLSITCFVYIALIILFHAAYIMDPWPNSHINPQIKIYPFPSDISFLRVIPIFIFAFTCHQNAFCITNELRNNTLNRLNFVITNSVTICFIVYCIIGYSGYVTYGQYINDDILQNYPQTISVAVVRMMLSVALAWSYPLQLFPTRNCIASILFNVENCDKISNIKFYTLTFVITFASFIIAMIVTSLGIVLEVIGSIGSPIISFILPGIFYYFAKSPQLKEENNYKIKKILAICLIVFGSLVIPFGLTAVFLFQ